MKYYKKNTTLGPKEQDKNISIQSRVANRIDHIRRKMSRGASNIYRMIKTRGKWGNKQLWGFREKGPNKARKPLKGHHHHKPPR